MRPHIPMPDPPRSIADTVECGLTAMLVIVVVIAILEICGVHLGLRH